MPSTRERIEAVMARLTTWKIYSTEGRYLGQHIAVTPATALAQYVSLLGAPPSENQSEPVLVTDGQQRASYRTDVYDIVPEDGGQSGTQP